MKRLITLVLVLLVYIPVFAQEVQVTVGEAVVQQLAPIYVTRGVSLYQCVYSEEDIGRPGKIAGITIYPQSTAALEPFPVKVWLGTTANSSLSSGTIPSSCLTMVYDGEITINVGSSPLYLHFPNPFRYQGDNLVLMIYKPYINYPQDSPCRFHGYRTIQPHTSEFFLDVSDNSSCNPENPPQDMSETDFVPKTTFHMIPLYDGPRLSCVPRSLEFDPTWEAHPRQETIRLSNPGTQGFQITGLELSDSENYSIISMPVLPLTLVPGESRTLSIRYLPIAIGEDPARLTITTMIRDPLNFIVDDRASTQIPLLGSCGDAYISSAPQTFGFDEATPPELPPYWSSIVEPATPNCWVYTKTGYSHSSPSCAVLERLSTSTASLFLVSPPMSPSLDATSKRLRFYACSNSTSGSFSVGVMSDPTNPATFRLIESIPVTAQYYQWKLCYVNLGTVLPYEQHFAFRTIHNDHIPLYLDDITIEDYPEYDLEVESMSGPPSAQPGTVSTISTAIRNWGRYTENSYTVKIFSSEGVELASVAGPAISPLGSQTVQVPWTPSGHGALSLYAKVVFAEDLNPANDSSLTGQVFVLSPDGQSVDIGQPYTYGGLPFSFIQNTFLSESIYLASEMGTAIGKLEAILLKPRTYEGIPPKHIKIWLGQTDESDIPGWIPANELTLVFDGMVHFEPGFEWMIITLDTPFLYNCYRNLVMLSQHPWEETTVEIDHEFRLSLTDQLTYYAFSNQNNINPDYPGITNDAPVRPLIKFIKDPGFTGNIQGTVTNTSGQPVSGATVSVHLLSLNVTTGADGAYSLPDLPMGEVLITCSLAGYFEVQDTLNLNEGQTLSHNLVLQAIPLVQVSGTVLASDTGFPLPNTLVYLTGYQTYSDYTDAAGHFEFPAIYGGLYYNYNLSNTSSGYGPSSGTILIPLSSGDLGLLYISEPTTAPTNITAVLNPLAMSVFISWEAGTSARELLGYKIWRIPTDQIADPTSWTQLTPAMITAIGFTDLAFAELSQGGFVWAVKSVYTNGMSSAPAFSNRVYMLTTKGLLSGNLTTSWWGDPIVNASITLAGDIDDILTHSDAQGNFYYLFFPGTYELRLWGHNNDMNYVWDGTVTLAAGEVTHLNLVLEPYVGVNDPSGPPLRTELQQNYPNPFRDATTLRFSLKEAARVTLDIYNLRGQLVRSILHESKTAGLHEIVWDGKDANGFLVGNGVYLYRMTCGKYISSKKMLRTQ